MALVNGLGGAADFGEHSLSRNDDGSTGAIDLSEVFPNGLNFFGEVYTEAFINTNGSITFGGPLSTFTPTAISSGTTPGIFVFWADVDTSGGAIDVGAADPAQGNSQGTNLVYYDLDQGSGSFTVTWDDVGYYDANIDRTNSFQLILTDASDEEGRSIGDFEITYIYEDIQWTTGDASGGTDGLGGTPARIGYSAGDESGTFFEFNVSGYVDALLALGNSDPRSFLSTSGGISADVFIDLPGELNAGINEDARVVV
ncbi:nidogen-like domain-containing protein [Sagittula sp. MA-2]|jgi:hypothetical protein|uniref:nidogen-like domain-containing protein n=1 Tax=Sagittula sp. MA-2 TaxID=3048007 RepID=UPI0024C3E8B0|nr:nidogen-like domain-containing protein [Sagittula sp. MA-2]WHZ33795.1 nidogen-like domain-containing protein [Sagittula sp. MA-2]